MSDHEYTPSSKFGKWFNDRLPLLTLANHLTDYPTPKNLNYWWTFGGILSKTLKFPQKSTNNLNFWVLDNLLNVYLKLIMEVYH